MRKGKERASQTNSLTGKNTCTCCWLNLYTHGRKKKEEEKDVYSTTTAREKEKREQLLQHHRRWRVCKCDEENDLTADEGER